MALPDLIEISPLAERVRAGITVPGSKSISNRALILAALARGQTTLKGCLWSEDTQIMVEALRQLGFDLEVQPDPEELCNRTIVITGRGGEIPRGGTESNPLELFVGNAGTAARFLSALVCLGPGVYRLHGVARMHERPQEGLFEALRQLGYRVEGERDRNRLPARIFGIPPVSNKESSFGAATDAAATGRTCSVNIAASSQFASALLLCARSGGWTVTITGYDVEESAYVRLTSELLKGFPSNGGSFAIEPDASSGAYFRAAEVLNPNRGPEQTDRGGTAGTTGISVSHWPSSGWQIDQYFPNVLERSLTFHFGSKPEVSSAGPVGQETATISRNRDLGDSIMMAIVLAPLANQPTRFTDLGRLRLQECERVMALRTELTKCGAKVVETGDTLEIFPSRLHGAEIETYLDHRMAMCFAILGLKVPGIKIKNPACVKKTFPNFFQKLAATPPHGLGVRILDKAGKRLALPGLLAE